ncbi:MAG: hypothetical protein JWQ93_3478 [Marmoricola sp.]|jgi:urea transport system substrate-binding protein|nr:hypothetical protein [Marmoricola sp.]
MTSLDPAGPSRRSFLKTAALAGVVAAAPLPLLSACGASGGGSGSGPIRIGVLTPLSGPWTIFGKAHLAGFQLATDQINAKGGTLGRKWELVVADSKTDSTVVTQQANRLAKQENVDFFAGTFTSAERNAAAPVVTAADKLLLYPTFYEGQNQDFYPGVCNPNIFMFGSEPSGQVYPFLEYMLNKHGKRFFLAGSDYVWPRETNRLVKAKLAELGGEVVGEAYAPIGTAQFGGLIEKIRNADTDVLFLSVVGSDSVAMRQQLLSSGLKDSLTVWSVGNEESSTSGIGPAASAGDYASFDYFWALDNPKNVEFKRAMTKKFPGTIMNNVGVDMYNAAHMAALAIEKAGSVETAKMRAGLEDLVFEDAPQGKVTMRAEDHQAALPSFLAKVREGWTGVDDMFEIVQSVDQVVPSDSTCAKLPLRRP